MTKPIIDNERLRCNAAALNSILILCLLFSGFVYLDFIPKKFESALYNIADSSDDEGWSKFEILDTASNDIEIKEDSKIFSTPRIFKKHTWASIYNENSFPVEVLGNGERFIAKIPPLDTGKFRIRDEDSLIFVTDGRKLTTKVDINAKPRITMKRLAPSGEEVAVREIQKVTGYRVDISDDYPDQLVVSFVGPVVHKETLQDSNTVDRQSNRIFDIRLNKFKNESSYESFTRNKESPYSIRFEVIIIDTLSQDTVKQLGIFKFGEW